MALTQREERSRRPQRPVTEPATSAARAVPPGRVEASATPAPSRHAGRLLRSREIEQTLLQIKGLVYARAILEDEGASAVELAEHTAELERQRRHLAELVRGFRPFLGRSYAELKRGC
jgi:hypothetical protein